jgi:hypothetical protein
MLQNTYHIYSLIAERQFKFSTTHRRSIRNGFYPISSVQSSTIIHSLQLQSHNRSPHARTHASHTHTHAITANQLFQPAVPFLHYYRNSLSLLIVRLANLQSYHIDNYAFTAIQLSSRLRIYVELYAVRRYLISFTSLTLFETFSPDVLSRFPNAGGRTPSPLKEIQ